MPKPEEALNQAQPSKAEPTTYQMMGKALHFLEHAPHVIIDELKKYSSKECRVCNHYDAGRCHRKSSWSKTSPDGWCERHEPDYSFLEDLCVEVSTVVEYGSLLIKLIAAHRPAEEIKTTYEYFYALISQDGFDPENFPGKYSEHDLVLFSNAHSNASNTSSWEIDEKFEHRAAPIPAVPLPTIFKKP